MSFNYEQSIWGEGKASLALSSPTYFRLRQSLQALDGLPAGARVLEIGCGAGQFIRTIKEMRPRLDCYGCDISQTAVDRARTYSDGVTYALSEEAQLPYANDFFDAILIYDVLEHVDYPDRFVAEVQRVVKPNGIFYSFVPCEGDVLSLWHLFTVLGIGGDLTKKYAGHINRLSRLQWITMFAKHQLLPARISYSEHILGQIVGVAAFVLMDRYAKRRQITQVNNEQFFTELQKKQGMVPVRIIVNTLVALESLLFSRIPSPNMHIVLRKS